MPAWDDGPTRRAMEEYVLEFKIRMLEMEMKEMGNYYSYYNSSNSRVQWNSDYDRIGRLKAELAYKIRERKWEAQKREARQRWVTTNMGIAAAYCMELMVLVVAISFVFGIELWPFLTLLGPLFGVSFGLWMMMKFED